MKAKIKEFRILIISVVIAFVIVIANMIVSSQVWNKNLNNQSMAIQKLNGDIEKQRVSSLNAADSAKSRVTDVPLKDLNTKDNLLIACINRSGKIIIPGGMDSIQAGDTVVIVTTHTGFQNIEDILR